MRSLLGIMDLPTGDPSCRLSATCASFQEIPRVPAKELSEAEFKEKYFCTATPVVIEGGTDSWPAREWTLETLMDRVGENEVAVREGTDSGDYRRGNK